MFKRIYFGPARRAWAINQSSDLRRTLRGHSRMLRDDSRVRLDDQPRHAPSGHTIQLALDGNRHGLSQARLSTDESRPPGSAARTSMWLLSVKLSRGLVARRDVQRRCGCAIPEQL